MPLEAFGIPALECMWSRIAGACRFLITFGALPIKALWVGPLFAPVRTITAYDPQVANCMIWRHDICELEPPKNRVHGVPVLLHSYFHFWRAGEDLRRLVWNSKQ